MYPDPLVHCILHVLPRLVLVMVRFPWPPRFPWVAYRLLCLAMLAAWRGLDAYDTFMDDLRWALEQRARERR